MAVVNTISLFKDVDSGEDGVEDGIPFAGLIKKESWHDVHVANDLLTHDLT